MTTTDPIYIEKQCFLCGPDEKTKEIYPRSFELEDLDPKVFSARRTTEHFHYRTVRCEACSLVFAGEILPDEKLNSLYSQSDFCFSDVTSILRKDYWRPLSKFVNLIDKTSALEVGCSNGFFLDELLDQGFKSVKGAEPSLHAIKNASDRVRPFIEPVFFTGRSTYPGQTFDLVASFHTLDHVSDPLGFLRACREVTAPKGLSYFITHNVNALQAKLLGDKSPIIDVEHIYLFNKKTLAQSVEKAGYKVLQIGNLLNSYPLSYWLRMFPMAPAKKDKVGLAMKRLGILELKPKIPAGNIFVIAQAM